VKVEARKAALLRVAGNAKGKRAGIVSARFYEKLADWLEDGAGRGLDLGGVAPERRTLVRVPGCFEVPLACRRLIDAGVDLVVALGVVVRGDTPHFSFVAGECTHGIMQVQLVSRVPVGFGILTTDTVEQAEQRADPARGDKGYQAAIAALSLLHI
jgi:6,7-dimethyl-8-ribityllumazine synthase